jgi:hypothetical protein
MSREYARRFSSVVEVEMKNAKPTVRRRAEKKLASRPKKKPASSINALKLVHELQAHQVELEMQNDELQSGRREVEESRTRFSDLYDYSPIGYVTKKPYGKLTKINTL